MLQKTNLNYEEQLQLITDGDCLPMHGFYQEFGEIVSVLNGYFFDYDKEYYDIEPFLDEL